MFKFQSIRFSRKIAALYLIPLSGLLLLAGVSIEDQFSNIKASENVIQLANFSVHASALVHELQKERGMSSLYLSSKGKEFGEEIQTQRLVTDLKLKELKDFLRTSAIASSTSINTSVSTTQKQLEQLQTTRDGISQLSISPK